MMTPEIEKIIRAMAAYKPHIVEGDAWAECQWCEAKGDAEEWYKFQKFEHKSDCPVELARAWVKRHTDG